MSGLTLVIVLFLLLVFVVLAVVTWLIGRRGPASEFLMFYINRATGMPRPAWQSPLTRGSWDDAWIAKAVRAFVEGAEHVDGQHPMGLLWTFTVLRERTVPFAMDMLRDEALQRDLIRPIARGASGARHSALPLVRICEVFEARMPVEAIPVMAPFLECGEAEAEAAAARCIAATGSLEALPLVRRAFECGKDDVVAATFTGLHWASNERMEAPFREAIWNDLKARFEMPGLALADRRSTGAAMLKVDKERSTDYLSEPGMLRLEREELGAALALLNSAEARPDPTLLRELVATQARETLSETGAAVAADAIRLLGRQRHAEDRNLLETLSAADVDSVASATLRDAAREGLFHWLGLEEAREAIWTASLTDENHSVPEEKRLLRAAYALDLEVNNGGFSQYFFNTAGEGWRDALEGLETMGLAKHRTLLQRACNRFGPEGPPADRTARQDALEELEGRGWAGFDDLDSAYYKLDDSLDAAAARYMVTHLEAFR